MRLDKRIASLYSYTASPCLEAKKESDSSLEAGFMVSVVMPAYNAERYVADAIKSVLNQTHQNLELIIVNDGSKDKTLEIAKSFKDERIKIVDLKENRGVSFARNVAFDVAKGNWITFIDADDMWKPERLEYLLGIISRYEYGKYFIADDFTLSYETKDGKFVQLGSEIRIWLPEIYRKFGSNDVIEIEYKDFFYIAFQPILPSKLVKENGLRFPENLSFGEDLYFYAKLFKHGLKMLLTKESFYFYRITSGSLTESRLNDFIIKVKKFEEALQSDMEFSIVDRELFKNYFETRIKKMKESDLKNNLLKNGFKSLIFIFLKHPCYFLRYLFANLSTPYKIAAYLRLSILARREGGIKRL